jgi:molecular chaperone DnaK (HSP70)
VALRLATRRPGRKGDQVLATNGDTFLGGKDFDQCIIDFILDEFKKIHGIDLGKDAIALQRIKSTAERAKIELSSTQQTDVNEPYIAMANGAPVHLNLKITRAKLESLVEALITRTIEPCRIALADASLKIDQIVTIKVYPGEREMAAANKGLGEFNLEGIPPAARGTPQIDVSFDIDANGILHVGARDKASGKENKITIKANSGLTEQEIQRMVQDGETNREEDKRLHALAESRNKGDALIHDVRKTITALAEKLDAEMVASFEADFASLGKAIEGNDALAIEAQSATLSEKVKKLESTATGKTHSPGTSSGQSDQTASNNEGSPAVDADFKEVEQR